VGQFLGVREVEAHSIVERSPTILTPEVSISFLDSIFLIEECLDEDITTAIIIHGFHV
jgi:hypothetical protein